MNTPGLSALEVLDRLNSDQVEAEVIMLTGQATVESAAQAMRLGANDYLCKPFPLPELDERCRIAFHHGQLRKENKQLIRSRAANPTDRTEMIDGAPQMERGFKLIERAGPSDKAILIQGESGTDKELVAKAIQAGSQRADAHF